MPFGAFFQKERLSIPLQISTILKTLHRVCCGCPTGAQASPFCPEASQLLPGVFYYCLQMSQMLTPGWQEGLQQQAGSTLSCKEPESASIAHYMTPWLIISVTTISL